MIAAILTAAAAMAVPATAGWGLVVWVVAFVAAILGSIWAGGRP